MRLIYSSLLTFALLIASKSYAVVSASVEILGIDLYDCWSSSKMCTTIVTSGADVAPCTGLDWRNTKEYVIQSDEVGYKDNFSALLAAYQAKTKLSIVGTDTCGVNSGEKIKVIRFGG